MTIPYLHICTLVICTSLLLSLPARAAERTHNLATITGKVTETGGNPLAGVNILVQGTTNGTSTNAAGEYTIQAGDNDVLVFSFIGFKTVEAPVSGRTLIDITLEEDLSTLKEIEVNAGYWRTTGREKTGNIASVPTEVIARQPVTNPLQAMTGRMAGVQIQQFTGLPGSGFSVRIRGRNSLRGDGNDPLYIIDGVPFTSTSLHASTLESANNAANPLNAINPADIESIEVLKDADATAIYGSRGANGVVLITTKKGTPGRTTVDISVYQGAGRVTRTMDILNTQQYLEMRQEAFSNDDSTPQFWDYDLNGTWDQQRYTDWQKTLIGGTAGVTNAQLSVSGGQGGTQFVMSGGFYRETTVFPGTSAYWKGSGHAAISHTSANNKFNASLSVTIVHDENNLPQTDLTPIALTLPPNAPAAFHGNGEVNWEDGTFDNPFGYALATPYRASTDNMVANVVAGYELAPGLNIKTNLGLTDMRMEEYSAIPIKAFYPGWGITNGESKFADAGISTWIAEPQATYRRTVAQGKLEVLAGATFQQNVRQGKALWATGYTSDAMLENIQAAASVTVQDAHYSQYRYNAVFGRINYSWKGKYLVNITGRRDGSSRFGPGKKMASFGAAGAAWIFSEENFLQNPFLSFGKLRASYGTTGSDHIPDYGYMDTWSATPVYQDGTGLIPARLVNPDFRWETNRKLEAALELGFLRDRIMTSVSWYRNRSSNQLVGLPLPSMTGFRTVLYNLEAIVQNTGWEFELTSTNVKSRSVTWTTALNVTLPDNKLIAYPGIENSPHANAYEVGRSLFIEKRFRFLEVDPQTGVLTFEDVDGNGNGMNFPADLQARKEISQTAYGGIQNTLRLKGWELDFFFQAVKQTGRNYVQFFNPPGTMSNQPVRVMDRWQQEGDISSIQRFTAGGHPASSIYNTGRNLGDHTISDASFIRLRNVMLAWQIPDAWKERMHLRNARLFTQGQNLLTITRYAGLDPETQTTQLPPLRILTAGIQLTF